MTNRCQSALFINYLKYFDNNENGFDLLTALLEILMHNISAKNMPLQSYRNTHC